LNNNNCEEAAQLYENCEKISQFLVLLELEGELSNIEKFRNKKADCLKNSNSQSNFFYYIP
jgi:hypothetical protein